MFQMSKLKEHLLKHFQIKTKEELMNILYGPNFKKSYIPFFTKFLADVRGKILRRQMLAGQKAAVEEQKPKSLTKILPKKRRKTERRKENIKKAI
uniref:Candidate secreted effector n=1 Tax=Meloidogyne incognita TaxID=6306 RepID=A0A914KW07_MELIC